MSTEDFENQEVQQIFDTLLNKTCSSWTQHAEMIRMLIKILVSNGTLTAKQTERALKENV